jgi:tRNA-binding protein
MTKPPTSAEAFFSVDLRVGCVVDVAEFRKPGNQAWKVTVDFGERIGVLRTSAQVTQYSKEELLGRLVIGTVNLGAKRIAGFRSEFLLLGAEDSAGVVHLLAPDRGSPGDSIC